MRVEAYVCLSRFCGTRLKKGIHVARESPPFLGRAESCSHPLRTLPSWRSETLHFSPLLPWERVEVPLSLPALPSLLRGLVGRGDRGDGLLGGEASSSIVRRPVLGAEEDGGWGSLRVDRDTHCGGGVSLRLRLVTSSTPKKKFFFSKIQIFRESDCSTPGTIFFFRFLFPF